MAARALQRENEIDSQAPRVNGEAFFITDGRPLPFWTFARKVRSAPGDNTRAEKTKVIPRWLILSLAITIEWLFWIFTAGQRTS